jgi:hypothetical protein
VSKSPFTQLASRCRVCGSLARVRTSREISRDYREAYFVCRNEACQHEFVASVSFLRTLVEPLKKAADLAGDATSSAVAAIKPPEGAPLLAWIEGGQ